MGITSGGSAAAALTPYPWRALTADRVVQLVVAAADDPGVARDDPKVVALTAGLDGVAWRALTADALCHRLLDALHAWHLRGHSFEDGLARLLAEGA